MTIESMTDTQDFLQSMLGMQEHIKYTWVDKEGKTREDTNTDYLHLVTIDSYERVFCRVAYDSFYVINIIVNDGHTVTIQSKNRRLINMLYKKILAKEDFWIDDLKETNPEFVL